MKLVKTMLGFSSLLIALCLLAACGGESEAKLLEGSWAADENYGYAGIHFNEDGTYARYREHLRDYPHSGGTYTFDGSRIELLGTDFESIPLRCSGKRETYEVTHIEENSFTIEIVADECSGESNVGDSTWQHTSDVISFKRCEDVKRDEGIFYDCIPVEGN